MFFVQLSNLIGLWLGLVYK